MKESECVFTCAGMCAALMQARVTQTGDRERRTQKDVQSCVHEHISGDETVRGRRGGEEGGHDEEEEAKREEKRGWK